MSGSSHLLVILIITVTICYAIEDDRDQDVSWTELKKVFEENKDLLQKYSAAKLLEGMFRHHDILKDIEKNNKKIQKADSDNRRKFISDESEKHMQRPMDHLRKRQLVWRMDPLRKRQLVWRMDPLRKRQLVWRMDPLRKRQLVWRMDPLRKRQLVWRMDPLRKRQLVWRMDPLRKRQLVWRMDPYVNDNLSDE